ncbi:hypothetical protein D3C71_880030 [compost metagenome]
MRVLRGAILVLRLGRSDAQQILRLQLTALLLPQRTSELRHPCRAQAFGQHLCECGLSAGLATNEGHALHVGRIHIS